MRTLTLVALLLAASVARGELITISARTIALPKTSPDPVSTTLEFLKYDLDTQQRTTSATLAIPGLTPVGDVTTVWTITEENAAQYGLDWAGVEDWSLGLATNSPTNHIRRFNWSHGENHSLVDSHPFAQFFYIIPIETNDRLLVFGLEKIEVEQTYWIHTPSTKEAKMAWRLTIDGLVVPEPASAMLFVLAGCCLHVTKSCRWRRWSRSH